MLDENGRRDSGGIEIPDFSSLRLSVGKLLKFRTCEDEYGRNSEELFFKFQTNVSLRLTFCLSIFFSKRTLQQDALTNLCATFRSISSFMSYILNH